MKQKGDCDYVGIRKDGKWTFTTSAFLLNPVWLEKIVLISKGEISKPEDELPVAGNAAKRSLTGIGAGLAVKGSFVEIESLVTGGPAERSGELKIGDKIVAISADDPPSVWGRIEISDTAPKTERDLLLSEVVKQIRGAAGTAVHLKIQPAGSNDPSQIKQLRIIRAEIKMK
jgi:C-terminal processing protease CtpA/Prc